MPAVAVELALRDVHDDAAIVTDAIDAIGGPVLLVGHSYGGVDHHRGRAPTRRSSTSSTSPPSPPTPTRRRSAWSSTTTATPAELGAAIVIHDDGTNTLDPALVGDDRLELCRHQLAYLERLPRTMSTSPAP